MPGSRRSMAYPTDHLLAVVDDPTAAAGAGRALVAAGIAAADVTVVRGDEGAERLDGLGGGADRGDGSSGWPSS